MLLLHYVLYNENMAKYAMHQNSKGEEEMSKAIEKAAEIINSKVDYIGDGMEGYAVLSLIDDKGYPTSSPITISKADGINWMSFLTGIGTNKVNRIIKNNKAAVCLATSSYNINLVGKIDVITDTETKKEHWQNEFVKHHDLHNSPKYCTLKFKTERYSIYFSKENLFEEGEF